MWQQVVDVFPQLESRVEQLEDGSRLSNQHYLAAPRGEIYSASYNMAQFNVRNAAMLRLERYPLVACS